MIRKAIAPGERNVLGGALEPCSLDPMTGFFRDGCCRTDGEDAGSHTVCAEMTAEFLAFCTGKDAVLVVVTRAAAHVDLTEGLLSGRQLAALAQPPAYAVGDISAAPEAASAIIGSGGPAAAVWVLPGVVLPAP